MGGERHETRTRALRRAFLYSILFFCPVLLLTCAEPHHKADREGVDRREVVQEKVPVSGNHVCENYYHNFLAERADLKDDQQRERKGGRCYCRVQREL